MSNVRDTTGEITHKRHFRQPEVIVDFKFDHGLFFIGVKNIGEKSAHKISVKFDKPLYGVGGLKEVSSLRLFKNIEFLPPQKEIETFLDHSSSYFQRKEPTQLKTEISYKDSQGNKYLNSLKHDLRIYKEIGYIKRTHDAEER